MLETIQLSELTTIASAILVIGGAAIFIVNAVKKTMYKFSKETIDTAFVTFSEDFTKKIDILSQKIETNLQESSESNKKVEKYLLSSARERINQAHEYYMEKGKINTHTLYALEDMYCNYKGFNGNSFTDKQMDELRNLDQIRDY